MKTEFHTIITSTAFPKSQKKTSTHFKDKPRNSVWWNNYLWLCESFETDTCTVRDKIHFPCFKRCI